MTSAKSLGEIIDSFITKCPSGTALVFDDMASTKVLSYRDLAKKIKEIVAEITEYVNEGDYIGLDVQNSMEVVVILFAFLKLKLVCYPLKLDGHERTICEVLQASGVRYAIVCSQAECGHHVFTKHTEKQKLTWHPLECLRGLVFVEIPLQSIVPCLCKEDIEFVVTSSGSTGQQKVIKVPGKCIVPNIQDLHKMFNVTSKDTIFMSSPLTFDASMVQIFISVIARATLLIVPDVLLKQAGNLCKVLFERNQTTILQVTPSLFHLLGNSLLQDGKDIACTCLRVVCLGAEPFPSIAELRKFIKKPHTIELYNIYGISEVSSWASVERVDLYSMDFASGSIDFLEEECLQKHQYDEDLVHREVSIGLPLSDTKIELRSEHGAVLLEGYGEIWIGGKDRVCLIGDEKESLQNTMRPSGDIGLMKNGKIYYIRRKDNRVKIFGKFVDLEQIEAVAEETDAVTSSICIYSKETTAVVGNLVLFLVVKDGFTEEDVKMCLSRRICLRLPESHLFMRFVFLKEIPLNSHGKKDRLMLQRTVVSYCQEEHTAIPESLDELLVGLFENVIRRQVPNFETYDRNKNFIENGGDSFAAIFLESQIREYLRHLTCYEIVLSSLYEWITSKSFEELSTYLAKQLVGRKKLGVFNRDSEKQGVGMHLGEGLEKLEAQHGQEGHIERQAMHDNDSKSNSDIQMKEERARARFIASNEKCLPSVGNFSLERDSSLGRKRKASQELTGRKVDAESIYFHTVGNDESEARQKGSQTHTDIAPFCRDIMPHNSLEKCSDDCPPVARDRNEVNLSKRVVEGSKASLNSRITGSQQEEYVYKFHGGNMEPASGISGDAFVSNRTLLWKRDLLLGTVDGAVGCFCSVSRGSRYLVCEYCIALGSKSVCSSIMVNLSVDSRTVMKMLWLCDALKCVDASPLIICNGNHSSSIVYIGSHSHLFYAINADSGDVIWKTKLGGRVESSATVSRDGKAIIIGCYDHYVYVISRKDGTKIWQLETGESVKCSPVVNKYSGFVYVGSHDHHMYAIDTQKLTQVWRTHCGGGSIFSSPTLSEDFKLLFVGTLGGKLVAINSETGEIQWKLCMERPIFSSPLFAAQHVCFCSVDGHIYMVSKSGTLRWSFQTSGAIFSSPCCAPSSKVCNFVVGCHDKAVYCISNDGRLLWRTQLDSQLYSTPAVVPCSEYSCKGVNDGHCASAGYLVFICSTDGTLYMLNFANGAIVKKHTFSNEIFSSPVLVKNEVIVGCRDNNVYCLSL